MPSRVSAIVLAAGMSTRMGTAKQLLRIGEKTLLEHVLDNLRGSQIDEIVVVLGGSAEMIRQQIPLDHVRIVVNETYREGMGTSIRTGLAAVDPQADAVLIVLADQPFVQSGTIDQLIRQYRDRRPQIVIPLYKGFRGNPVLLDRSVFPEIMSLTGDIGCRAIFGAHTENILKVPVEDMGILLDVDTQADFERLQSGPRRQLVIIGEDAVARALAQFGRLLGFSVTIVDPFLEVGDVPGADRVLHELDLTRLPTDRNTCIVVASRGRFDEEAVEQALDTDASYVALVAGKKRAREIQDSLKAKGLTDEKRCRLRAPAGLDIRAESPEEIALSVMAEIVAR